MVLSTHFFWDTSEEVWKVLDENNEDVIGLLVIYHPTLGWNIMDFDNETTPYDIRDSFETSNYDWSKDVFCNFREEANESSLDIDISELDAVTSREHSLSEIQGVMNFIPNYDSEYSYCYAFLFENDPECDGNQQSQTPTGSWSINNKTVQVLKIGNKEIQTIERVSDGAILYQKDDYDLTITSSIGSVIAKNEATTFTISLTKNDTIATGVAINYVIKQGNTTLSSGSGTTNANGQITTLYTGAGRGDIDIIATFGAVQETLSIYDVEVVFDTSDLTKYYKDPNKQFIANVYENSQLVTKTDIQYNNVTGTYQFNMNGVYYVRSYNASKEGCVLNINLMPYLTPTTITTYYKTHGRTFSTTNTITVLSHIISNDLTKYYLGSEKFTVTILDNDGNPAQSSSVQFNLSGDFYNRTTNSEGITQLPITRPAGTYIITTQAYDESVSNTITILKAPTTITLSANSQSISTTDTLTLSGTLTPYSNISGSIKIYNGNTLLKTVTASGNNFTTTLTGLSIGTYNLKAVYEGDSNYENSESSAVTVTVSKTPTTVTLSANSPSILPTESLTLSGTLTGTTSGSIKIYNENTLLTTVNASNGSFTTTLTGLTIGTYNLKSVYEGDSNYEDSESSVITVDIYEPLIIEFNGNNFQTYDSSSGLKGSNMIIDWGDGQTVLLPSDTKIPNHSYSVSGNYTITIKGKITYINTQCFRERTNITSVNIPNGLSKIRGLAFYRCTNLVSVKIPSSVASMEGGVFTYCSSLIDYQLYWNDPPITWSNSLMPNNTDTYFTIPNGTTANYVAKSFPSAKLIERGYQLSITSDKLFVETNESATVTIKLTDANNTAVSGKTVFYGVRYEDTPQSIINNVSSGTTNSNGEATFTYTGNAKGNVNLIAHCGTLTEEITIKDGIVHLSSSVSNDITILKSANSANVTNNNNKFNIGTTAGTASSTYAGLRWWDSSTSIHNIGISNLQGNSYNLLIKDFNTSNTSIWKLIVYVKINNGSWEVLEQTSYFTSSSNLVNIEFDVPSNATSLWARIQAKNSTNTYSCSTGDWVLLKE